MTTPRADRRYSLMYVPACYRSDRHTHILLLLLSPPSWSLPPPALRFPLSFSRSSHSFLPLYVSFCIYIYIRTPGGASLFRSLPAVPIHASLGQGISLISYDSSIIEGFHWTIVTNEYIYTIYHTIYYIGPYPSLYVTLECTYACPIIPRQLHVRPSKREIDVSYIV
jgi:hypothetical protein